MTTAFYVEPNRTTGKKARRASDTKQREITTENRRQAARAAHPTSPHRGGTATVRFSAEVPPALRQMLAMRAQSYGMTTTAMLGVAVGWFVVHAQAEMLPPLSGFDPDDVPDVQSSFPRLTSFIVPDTVRDDLDALVGDGRFGKNRSAVIRYALCSYLTACVGRYQTPLTSTADLIT